MGYTLNGTGGEYKAEKFSDILAEVARRLAPTEQTPTPRPKRVKTIQLTMPLSEGEYKEQKAGDEA